MTVNLIARLPDFMQDYDEMRRLYDSQNPEFDLLWRDVDRLRNNLFILSADEEGLRRFERVLQISPFPGDTLEARRLRVLVLWNDNVPYTIRWLYQMLAERVGVNNFIVDRDVENSFITVSIITDDLSLLAEMRRMLRLKIPSSMGIWNNRIAVDNIDTGVYHAGGFMEEIQEEFNDLGVSGLWSLNGSVLLDGSKILGGA